MTQGATSEELIQNAVLGHPLRRYVMGDVTRMFIETMLTKLRITGVPFSVPYRCDSPNTKRYMEMRLSLSDHAGHVLASHLLIKEEPMPLVRVWATPASAPSATPGPILKRCSMCNRLTGKDGIPMEPENFANPAAEAPLRVIYHVCQECQLRLRKRLACTTKSHPKVA